MLAAYLEIFRVPNFRRFWAGFTISVVGDSLSRVALTWFVYELTGSAEALGWLMLCYTGPIIVGGFLAGWLLDRFDRRAVMIADNLIRGVAFAALPALYALGALAVWQIYLVAAIYGLLMMIALAGGPTMIPSLVAKEQLATANALEMLSFTLGGVIGPVVAGLLISRIGAPNVIIIDALSYLAYAALLARIVLPPHQAASAAQPGRYGIGQAVALLTRTPILLATTLMFLVFNIGGGAIAVVLPIMADRLPGGGPELYGILLGTLAVGEVISTVLAGVISPQISLGWRICIAQMLAGLALLLLLGGASVWVVGVGLALYGAGGAPLTIWAQTLRMQIIPAELRGRTFALLRMLMQSGNPIGGTLAGLLLAGLGIPLMVGLAAALVGLPGAFGALVRDLREDRV